MAKKEHPLIIFNIRSMTDTELTQRDWSGLGEAMVIELSNGVSWVASADVEGNGPGLFYCPVTRQFLNATNAGAFLRQRVDFVRAMFSKELHQRDWHDLDNCAVAIELHNALYLIPVSDDDLTAPGALFEIEGQVTRTYLAGDRREVYAVRIDHEGSGFSIVSWVNGRTHCLTGDVPVNAATAQLCLDRFLAANPDADTVEIRDFHGRLPEWMQREAQEA